MVYFHGFLKCVSYKSSLPEGLAQLHQEQLKVIVSPANKILQLLGIFCMLSLFQYVAQCGMFRAIPEFHLLPTLQLRAVDEKGQGKTHPRFGTGPSTYILAVPVLLESIQETQSMISSADPEQSHSC